MAIAKETQTHAQKGSTCVTALSFCCVLSDSGGEVVIERLALRCYHAAPLFGLCVVGRAEQLACVGKTHTLR